MSSTQTLPQWATQLAVFDLETTGVDTKTSRIVSACIAELDAAGKVVKERNWLVNPGIDIPIQATRVHGITTAQAKAEGQDPTQAVAEITQLLQSYFAAGIAVVAYNAAYDFSLLDAEQARNGIAKFQPTARPIIDPLIIDKQLDRYRRGKRTLSAATEHYQVVFTDAHSASPDAIAAGRVAQALAHKYPDELALSALELHAAQIDWAKAQNDNFVAWRRSNGDPGFHSSGQWPIR